MTSIICWNNPSEDWFPGLWAVADSRVSSEAGTMTDSLQKLFALSANIYCEDDTIAKNNPHKILNFCYGFAGSTLIGNGVKDTLALILDNLNEISYFHENKEVSRSIEERIPSIMEIAKLAQKIAQKYLIGMGAYYPSNARCEILIFGFCKNHNDTKIFLLRNSPDNPAKIILEEKYIASEGYVILGDMKKEVLKEIERKNIKFAKEKYWKNRTPIIALQQIIKDSSLKTIGGYAQICMATRFISRTMYIPDIASNDYNVLGFDIFKDLGALGGFSISFSPGLNLEARLLD